MNARPILSRSKVLVLGALLAVAGVAQAGNVSWSVGVNAPVYGPGQVRAVVSSGPVYYDGGPPQVVYVQPAPVYVQPPPRYYAPQPVVYEAAPPPPRCLPRFGLFNRWHHHRERAVAYADGYRQGYERGHDRGNDYRDDDRRGGWERRDR